MESTLFKRAIPVLHVVSSMAAEQFYCVGLGFHRQFAYRPDNTSTDPCYLGLSRDDVALHASSFPGDGSPGMSVVNLLVDDIDALHADLVARSIPIDLPPTDQTWGGREMYLKDPDGNRIRFVLDRAG